MIEFRLTPDDKDRIEGYIKYDTPYVTHHIDEDIDLYVYSKNGEFYFEVIQAIYEDNLGKIVFIALTENLPIANIKYPWNVEDLL